MIDSGTCAIFGRMEILNVGAGDTKLSFNKNDPAECIRAARIVRDMIRRGYALLVEVEEKGERVFRRATDFDEAHAEYIIADLDPEQAARADAAPQETPDEPVATDTPITATRGRKGKAGRPRRVAADKARAVAVARSAGG